MKALNALQKVFDWVRRPQHRRQAIGSGRDFEERCSSLGCRVTDYLVTRTQRFQPLGRRSSPQNWWPSWRPHRPLSPGVLRTKGTGGAERTKAAHL